jgi:hypothetical protein
LLKGHKQLLRNDRSLVKELCNIVNCRLNTDYHSDFQIRDKSQTFLGICLFSGLKNILFLILSEALVFVNSDDKRAMLWNFATYASGAWVLCPVQLFLTSKLSSHSCHRLLFCLVSSYLINLWDYVLNPLTYILWWLKDELVYSLVIERYPPQTMVIVLGHWHWNVWINMICLLRRQNHP